MGNRSPCRCGVHDRSKPQYEGQDGSHGADGLYRAGNLRQGRPGRSSAAFSTAGRMQTGGGRGVFSLRVLAGCAAYREELEAIQRAGGRSAAGAPRKRLYRTDYQGTCGGKPGCGRKLRLSSKHFSHTMNVLTAVTSSFLWRKAAQTSVALVYTFAKKALAHL